ncbi:MAG: hypothetical protein R3272_08610 [Candidatus Promineifilaceae bacterium]|nr:hypothetical protein [Candidatus Promineifilaceae bacterium]
MRISAIVHISNEEPVLCELEDMPQPNSQFIVVNSPRRRDGNELHYLDEEVSQMVVPWHRINFIQILPSAEVEDVIGFVRE